MTRSRRDPWAPVAGRRPAELRASDAERHEVGDALSRHFAEGRLDQAEFAIRLDRAMRAVTRGELDALFHDLPQSDGAPIGPRPRRMRPGVVVLLVLLSAVAVGSLASSVHLPWALVALAVVVLWLRARRRRTDRAAVGAGR